MYEATIYTAADRTNEYIIPVISTLQSVLDRTSWQKGSKDNVQLSIIINHLYLADIQTISISSNNNMIHIPPQAHIEESSKQNALRDVNYILTTRETVENKQLNAHRIKL